MIECKNRTSGAPEIENQELATIYIRVMRKLGVHYYFSNLEEATFLLSYYTITYSEAYIRTFIL